LVAEKQIPLEEAKKLVQEALVSTGLVIKTSDYIYAIYEKAPDKWINVSIILDEKTAWVSEATTKKAILLLIDEVSKSLPQYKDQWKPILDEAELEDILSEV